jgi:glycosyltransferase involved in cell wall biosynthesis
MNVTNSIQGGSIKVLYMCEWTGRGIHPVWLQYAYGLHKAGACVYLATSGKEYDPGTMQEAIDYNLNIVELPEFFDRRNNFRNAKRAMASWLSVNSVDVIHCQGFRELYDVTQACRINRQKHRIVMTDRNSLAWTGFGAMKRIALILREKPWIITLSQSHRDKIGRIPWMAARTAFIPNGVNTNIFRYVSRPCRSIHDIPRLIYPAYFTPCKGHSVFLDLCQKLAMAGRRFELLLAGYGPLEDSVRSKIKSLGLTDYVKQLGRVPWKALPELHAKCDIGVFPSLSEMMPNAVLEMMSTGLPVVAYDTGGIGHMIEHGKTGYITAVRDKKLFRSYLEHLMDNPDIARAIGEAASAAMHAHFSIEAVSKQTLALYNSICMGSQKT